MKLFRHYKQKYYKLYGLAKHSEDLSEYAYYECLYPNPEGQFWIRPTELFFGTTEVNGKTTRRFEEATLTLEDSTNLNESEINLIAPQALKIFGDWDLKQFREHARTKTDFYLIKAFVDGSLVGFALGHRDDNETFCSWLCGVLPDFQRLGIASALMQQQHAWCKEHRYNKVCTRLPNRFREMLHLNLKFGFEIVGTNASMDRGELDIVMEKNLTAPKG